MFLFDFALCLKPYALHLFFIMGKQGRFGKYGESKRVDRLRRARITTPSPHGSEIGQFRSRLSSKRTFYKKPNASISPAGKKDVHFITRLSGKVFEIYTHPDSTKPSPCDFLGRTQRHLAEYHALTDPMMKHFIRKYGFQLCSYSVFTENEITLL